MASRPPRRKSLSGSIDIEGSRVSYEIYNGGLGKRYFDKLGQDLDQIIQVDVSTGVTETRGSVRGRAVKLAIEMKQRGIKHDDIIVMCSRTNTDQVIVVLAALFIGANLAPLDPEFNYKEVLDLMKQLKPKLCFGDSRTIPQFDRIFQALNMNITTVNFNPDQAGTVQFRKLLLAHKEDEKFTPIFVEAPRTEVAFILPTQGTTGLPKLICLSHENIFVQTVILLEILGQPDKVISFFPISWFFQMILVCLTFERPVTRIIPVMFTERNACKIIHDFSIRHAILGTDYAMKMANSPALRDYNLNCLRVVMIGTVNTMKHDVQTLRQLMPHVKFLQCYCLTETGCIAATRLSSYSKSMFKQGGIGPLTMNCRVRIVDTETRKGVGPNSYGELLYTGDGLMLGYLRQPEKTKQSMEKGFFKTGDVAMVDEDGWLYVKGRTDDLITMDDFKFSPLDLEEVILTHPAVKDVVVIGNDREIIALVKKQHKDVSLSTNRLQLFIADRCPERQRPTKIIYMEHFPRTSIGNVLKRILRRDLLEMKIHYTSSIASIETTAVRRSTSVERPSVSSSFVSLDSRRDTSYSETSFKNERFISDVLSSNMLRTVFGNYVYDEMLEEHINENTQ
ncbi:unnamed protein product [Callosobruchus maculatus]|uniref:Uncharacterized protein n=1 Tax=Callosobruchus maculatus TaxID=64391 RepID=A0A653BFV1_CALMS|nr:unnamed protein product [Callosobruchus maculatus]